MLYLPHVHYSHGVLFMLKLAKSTAVLAWLLLIFVTSEIPIPPADPAYQKDWFDYIFDKDVHMLMYGVLAVLLLSWLREFNRRRITVYALTVIVALAYGVFDEWHQSFVPGRGVSGWDVVFDGIGALAGIALWRIWHVRSRYNRDLKAQLVHRRGTASMQVKTP